MKQLAIESGLPPQEADNTAAEVAEAALTPEEQLDQWHDQLGALAEKAPSEFRHDLKYTRSLMRDFIGSRYTRESAIGDVRERITKTYQGFQKDANQALTAERPKIGDKTEIQATEPFFKAGSLKDTINKRLAERVTTEEMLGAILGMDAKGNAIQVAADETNRRVQRAHGSSVERVFNPVYETIEKTPVDGLDLDGEMRADRVGRVKARVDATIEHLDKVFDELSTRKLGSTAMGFIDYDTSRAVRERLDTLRKALSAPTYAGMNALSSRAYRRAAGLPGMDAITAEVTRLVNLGRGYNKEMLLEQADKIVEQRKNGVPWQQIDSTVQAPWTRPAYERAIDKEFESRLAAGESLGRINRLLFKKYNPDDPENEAAAKYLSQKYASMAGKNNRDASQDHKQY